MSEVSLGRLRVVETTMPHSPPRASNRQLSAVPVASTSVSKLRCFVRNLRQKRYRKEREQKQQESKAERGRGNEERAREGGRACTPKHARRLERTDRQMNEDARSIGQEKGVGYIHSESAWVRRRMRRAHPEP